MEKILFLDMDGAGANSTNDIDKFWDKMEQKGLSPKEIRRAYDKEFGKGLEAIFPAKAELVSKIIAETGAKIVWSTSWRLCEPYINNIQSARQMLTRRGMPGHALIAYTPDLRGYGCRGQEIRKYLEQHFTDPASYRSAVLDDTAEAGFDLPASCRFFRTRERQGLTSAIAQRIINWLNRKEEQEIELEKHCRLVDNYLFFLNGPLSQWYPAEIEEEGIVFNCCEQYMMFYKAILFNDEVSAAKILDTAEPREQKRLGRQVKNFNARIWNCRKQEIVFQGNYLKFTQHPSLKHYLLNTGKRIIAEANKHDSIWGIGMFADDRNLLRKELWGKNLLGTILMEVRAKIAAAEKFF